MSFHTRVKVGGWATHEKLTSTQANQLDIDHADQRDWYYARSVSGLYTLDTSGQDHVLLCDGTAGCTILLTAAVANRVVRIKYQTSAGGSVSITPNGTDTIEGLNATYKLTQIGSEVTLVGISGGWAIIGRGHNLASKTFTATTSSAWTAPAGCYFIEVELCGGGGGGAGSTAGTTSTGNFSCGGPGGGGAPFVRKSLAVTPGQAYDVTIGAGGIGGGAGAAGSDGNSTLMLVHGGSPIIQARGGGGGSAPAGVSTGGTIAPGGTIAFAPAVVGTSWDATAKVAPPGAGGYGCNGASGSVVSSGGSPCPAINGTVGIGGIAGTNGVASGSYNGGGAGGGGGGGPYGNGAAGANGGNGNNAGAGAAGSAGNSASANTGGGGGGAGGGGFGSSSGGAGNTGGNGGSGQITIYWRE